MFAIAFILPFSIGAPAEPPKFSVVNKCPPSFKVTNKMPAAPAVAAPVRPFTPDGTATAALYRDVAGFSTSSGVIYQMAPTGTSARAAMPNGRTVRGCVSYG